MHFSLGPLPLALLCLLLLCGAFVSGADVEEQLDAGMHHLGNDQTPEWSEAPAAPEGVSFELLFESAPNSVEWTLAFTQRSVNARWSVRINDVEVAACRRADGLLEVFHPLPPGTVVLGENRLTLTTDQPDDDITFGRVRLIHQPFRVALNLRDVEVRVTDRATSEALPARITIRRADGVLPDLFEAQDLHQAVRPGVVYTDHGVARFAVRAGVYEVFAARGPEWGLARAELFLEPGPVDAPAAVLELSIEREVDPGRALSVDTHIHTLTFSGHGDSSVEERMVTLAGEGLDVAISTDHNHNTDYAPYQRRLGLERQFLTIVGNEVTTPIGHFNAFPLKPEDEPPPHELRDVAELVRGMRDRGAQAVILNHPRWPTAEEGPFGVIELNHFTGSGNGSIFESFPFDAMELVNSCTEESDPLLLFRDWFSLLNAGERVVAVGSSDSHTVGEPVGGGRTYVHGARGPGAGPEAIDVDALCAAIREGRSSISMGIYVDTFVATQPAGERASLPDSSSIGDHLTPPRGGSVKLRLEVQAPSWVRPRRALLFGNGVELAAFELDTEPGQPTHLTREVELTDEHGGGDAWLVWVVLGDGLEAPHWPLTNDYTLAATNPVYVDWSGDGSYQSPRATAAALFAAHDLESPALQTELAQAWEPVRLHALGLARSQFLLEAYGRLRELGLASGEEGARLDQFLRSLGK